MQCLDPLWMDRFGEVVDVAIVLPTEHRVYAIPAAACKTFAKLSQCECCVRLYITGKDASNPVCRRSQEGDSQRMCLMENQQQRIRKDTTKEQSTTLRARWLPARRAARVDPMMALKDQR